MSKKIENNEKKSFSRGIIYFIGNCHFEQKHELELENEASFFGKSHSKPFKKFTDSDSWQNNITFFRVKRSEIYPKKIFSFNDFM